MKKLLITGASGLLGQHLCQYFSSLYEVIGTQNSTVVQIDDIHLETVDLSDKTQTSILMKKYSPDFVIHTAALTSVDECEVNPELAYRINVLTTKNLVDNLKGSAAKFLYISTDHLFTGHDSYCTEESTPHPVNVYAETKLLAEQEALKFPDSLILRTNFYGGHSKRKTSFSSWIYNELKQGKSISMFTDSHFTPISIYALTANIEAILKSELKGIYNFVGSEKLSKYEFGIRLANVFDFPEELVKPILMENLKLNAKRPKDMSLSIKKIQKDLPVYLAENVTDGLMAIKKNGLI